MTKSISLTTRDVTIYDNNLNLYVSNISTNVNIFLAEWSHVQLGKVAHTKVCKTA